MIIVLCIDITLARECLNANVSCCPTIATGLLIMGCFFFTLVYGWMFLKIWINSCLFSDWSIRRQLDLPSPSRHVRGKWPPCESSWVYCTKFTQMQIPEGDEKSTAVTLQTVTLLIKEEFISLIAFCHWLKFKQLQTLDVTVAASRR